MERTQNHCGTALVQQENQSSKREMNEAAIERKEPRPASIWPQEMGRRADLTPQAYSTWSRGPAWAPKGTPVTLQLVPHFDSMGLCSYDQTIQTGIC